MPEARRDRDNEPGVVPRGEGAVAEEARRRVGVDEAEEEEDGTRGDRSLLLPKPARWLIEADARRTDAECTPLELGGRTRGALLRIRSVIVVVGF